MLLPGQLDGFELIGRETFEADLFSHKHALHEKAERRQSLHAQLLDEKRGLAYILAPCRRPAKASNIRDALWRLSPGACP